MEKKNLCPKPKQDTTKTKYKKILELSFILSLIILISVFLSFEKTPEKKISAYIDFCVYKIESEDPKGTFIKSKHGNHKPQLTRNAGIINCLSIPPDNIPQIQDVEEDDIFICVFSEKPTIIKFVQPQYPDTAKSRKIEGMVVVKVLIDTLGNVEKTEIIKSIPELDQAALDAAKQCKFSPAKQRNRLVKMWMTIPFRFK